MSDRYIRFDQKQDNVDQTISADHINQLQDVSQSTQKNIFHIQDTNFLEKALFILEHHRTLNALWADTFDDTDKIDISRTTGLIFSEAEKAIVFPDGSLSTEGILYSQSYNNPNNSNIKKIMVLAQGNKPDNTDIIISVTNNGVDWFDVPLSQNDLFEIPTDGTKLKLRARFLRSDTSVSPRLDSWSILFRDSYLDIIEMPDGSKVVFGQPDNRDEYDNMINVKHAQLMEIGPDDHHAQEHAHNGMDGSGLISHAVLTDIGEDDHHTKDHQHGEDGVSLVNLGTDVTGTLDSEHLSYLVWTGHPGQTGLYFDPAMGDRLTYVKTPDDETYMFYDLATERLSHTITINQGIAIWEQMIYGEYLNSQKQTQIVLKGTEKTHHDATDVLIKTEIEKITAPKQVQGLVIRDTGVGGTLEAEWQANDEHDLLGYNLYMSTNSGTTWTLINTSGLITSLGYMVTSLTDGFNYVFAVTAIDNKGYESIKSTKVSGIPTLTI